MESTWLTERGLDRLPEFLSALAIGLMIGLERERNPSAKAGLRTFAIVALCGASAAALAQVFGAPLLIAVGLAAVALTLIAAHYNPQEREPDPGTTTVAAAMACYLFAVMALSGSLQLSVMLAIITTTLLYFKAELGGFARALQRPDLISILQFAVVTFVVLPVLPDLDLGPYHALNPRQVWLMVVLISGVSLAGYIALRFVEGRYGTVLLGLFGGLVSSTATTLAYSRSARVAFDSLPIAVSVILTANLMLLVRLTVLAAVVAPGVLHELAPILGGALLIGVSVCGFAIRSQRHDLQTAPSKIANPTELRVALAFAALYAMVLLLAAWLADIAGPGGVYAVASVSGLTDVDPIALSSMRLAGIGRLSQAEAATAIGLAICANATFKLGITAVVGGKALFLRCLPGMLAVVAGAAIGIAWIAYASKAGGL